MNKLSFLLETEPIKMRNNKESNEICVRGYINDT